MIKRSSVLEMGNAFGESLKRHRERKKQSTLWISRFVFRRLQK